VELQAFVRSRSRNSITKSGIFFLGLFNKTLFLSGRIFNPINLKTNVRTTLPPYFLPKEARQHGHGPPHEEIR